jgi:hypothetical protein
VIARFDAGEMAVTISCLIGNDPRGVVDNLWSDVDNVLELWISGAVIHKTGRNSGDFPVDR